MISSFGLRTSLVRHVVALGLIGTAACTGATSSDAPPSTADEDLRVLTPAEIVGTIAEGQTIDVPYPGTPRYRALSFQGGAGDSIDVWVRASDGDAVALLTTEAFKRVARNDDADPTTTDAHVTATLPAAGKYFIVVYERDQQPTTFHVSRVGGSESTNAGDDPFPVCTGAPQMPTTGTLYLTGGGTWTSFVRTCDAFGSCTSWAQDGASVPILPRGDDPHAFYIEPSGGLFVGAQIGPTRQDSDYDCKTEDEGSGQIDPATGIGSGNMTASWHCNIRGGSGGPYGPDEHRTVDIRYGETCLSLVDPAPSGPNYGTQRRSALVIHR